MERLDSALELIFRLDFRSTSTLRKQNQGSRLAYFLLGLAIAGTVVRLKSSSENKVMRTRGHYRCSTLSMIVFASVVQQCVRTTKETAFKLLRRCDWICLCPLYLVHRDPLAFQEGSHTLACPSFQENLVVSRNLRYGFDEKFFDLKGSGCPRYHQCLCPKCQPQSAVGCHNTMRLGAPEWFHRHGFIDMTHHVYHKCLVHAKTTTDGLQWFTLC
eukprot:725625-Amphidinium_carterae.2